MKRMVQLLLAAPLCGCMAAAPRPDGGGQRVDPIPVSLALEEVITTGIRQHLADPASARFGTMLAGERTLSGRHEIVVCGMVNARNPAGGDKPFMARVYPDAGSTFELVAMDDESPNARLAVEGDCRAAGLAILESDSKKHL